MNTQSDPQNELSRVLQKICEIAEKSVDGDYIFRGESRFYGKVVSSLYRQYDYDIEADDFDIEFVQKEILDEARRYTEKTDELEILVELHYHGGVTNLIEFTTDSHIALFFACDGAPSEDGRIILQKRDSVAGYLKQPHEPKQRIIAQKIVFVQPPKGFISPDEVITIPADLKLPMLAHLRKSHGISTEIIHNDLHGFIRNWNMHKSAYTQFHRGKTCRKRADSVQNWGEKLKWYERAIVHYTEALELKPDFFEGYNNRGSVYADAGDFNRAIQDHNMAIKLKPDYASAYNNRGIVYYHIGDFDRAIQDYYKAIELRSDYVSAYNNLGIAYSKQGKYENAIKYYSKAIKLKPDYAEAYSNCGVVYEKKGEYDKAIENHNRAIEFKPDFAGAYYNLGIVYREIGDRDREFQNYTAAIELKPDFADAFGNRGIIYALRGDDDKAIQDYTTAITLNQNHADAYFNRGISYGAKEDYRKAIQDYSCAIDLKSDYVKAYCNRGEAWIHLKEWEKAKADLSFARDSGMDIIASFHNDYESVEDFEQKNDVQLPEDIAAMLMQQ